MDATETITVADGYRAMFAFLEAYWERGGRIDESIAVLLGSMNFSETAGPEFPLDKAQWSDWLEAVKATRQ